MSSDEWTDEDALDATLESGCHLNPAMQLEEAQPRDVFASNVILGTYPHAIITENVLGEISYVNPAACKLLKYDLSQLIGKPIAHVFTCFADGCTYHLANSASIQPSIAAEGEKHGIVFCQSTDGNALELEWRCWPLLLADQIVGWGYQLEDPAKRDALSFANSLIAIKNQVLTNLSHELRTPLHGVLGFTDIGLRNYGDEKLKSIFGKIRMSADRLLQTINNLLDFSNIEHGRLIVHEVPTDVKEIVNRVLSHVKEEAREKGVDIDVEFADCFSKQCVTDGFHIQQILTHVLTNAIKFTDRGGIKLNVRHEENVLSISVEDSGVGICEGFHSDIFDPFVQGDMTARRKFGGNGLGLSIAKRILNAINGSISISSNDGLGTKVAIRIPCESI